jgi:CRISPR-associated endonuclease Csy4
MSGYCQQSDIKVVPVEAKFRTVSRKQTTMSPAKLRHLLKLGTISELEAKA